MTQKKDLKRRVRERMAKTGERYASALRQVKAKVEPGLEADSYSLQAHAEAAGLKCQLLASRAVYRWALPDGGARLAERFAAVVAALEGDPAGVLFQRAAAGQRVDPEADARFAVLRWRERLSERLRYARRLDLGLRGVSTDGCMLAFDYDGRLVVASISAFGFPGAVTVSLDTGGEFLEARDVFDGALPRLIARR